MSGTGAPAPAIPTDLGKDTTVTIVAATWHDQVMSGLIAGARRALEAAGVTVRTVRVPGTFELALGATYAIDAGADAVVALGVVIRGGTPHFDYVCEAATRGLTDVSLAHSTPVGFGVLTCDDDAQALDRAGLEDSNEDKGFEAACAALDMLALRAGLAAR
ncbi:6,7-dimethyl-8-ribityllumazine synthase [Nanchangia anserum]|uniref:6,7-dimethyl-8-ribityllumazine synthase n=1 Tax=Nanchangia anserum TaxID=2692125 RepID=A0A8I0GBG2_9ACTO|nr:6,7-dimethyl-8-ribityllumazine synthase [Nanchangia anserum]MBD3689095.1 6,7-dimethyl-8-ribityllumazine synthase [Nanchangia anserum]QOX81333.1 6,7-dimethyl-8-ribityllumazine synthase [Nanchangia anserum]